MRLVPPSQGHGASRGRRGTRGHRRGRSTAATRRPEVRLAVSPRDEWPCGGGPIGPGAGTGPAGDWYPESGGDDGRVRCVVPRDRRRPAGRLDRARATGAGGGGRGGAGHRSSCPGSESRRAAVHPGSHPRSFAVGGPLLRTRKGALTCCWWSGTPTPATRAAGRVSTCCGPCRRPDAAKPRDWWSAWRTSRWSGSCPAPPCAADRPWSRWRVTASWRSNRWRRWGWGPVPPRCWLRHAVLCSHGETIGQLLTQLQADGLVVEDPLDWPKGSTWLLQRTDHRQVRGRLLAPLQLELGRAR